LIVWRIWLVDKESEKYRFPFALCSNSPTNTLSRAMRNIVESGLLYTTAVIFAFVAYTTQSTLMYLAGSFVSRPRTYQ
jgi:hypothetical protein